MLEKHPFLNIEICTFYQEKVALRTCTIYLPCGGVVGNVVSEQ